MSSSKRQQQRTMTSKEFPLLEQKVELVCHQCGMKGKYDVGRIFLDPEIVGGRGQEEPRISEAVGFTGYFHCRHCGAGGPWDLPASTMLFLTALMLEVQLDPHWCSRRATVYRSSRMGFERAFTWESSMHGKRGAGDGNNEGASKRGAHGDGGGHRQRPGVV